MIELIRMFETLGRLDFHTRYWAYELDMDFFIDKMSCGEYDAN